MASNDVNIKIIANAEEALKGVKSVGDAFSSLSKVVDGFAANVQGIKIPETQSFAAGIFDGFQSATDAVMGFLNPLNLIPAVFGGITSIASTMFSGLTGSFSMITGAVSSIGSAFSGLIGIMTSVGSMVMSAIMAPFQLVGAAFSTVMGAVTALGSAFGEAVFFLGNLGQAFQTLVTFAQPLIMAFEGIAAAVSGAVEASGAFEQKMAGAAAMTRGSAADMELLRAAALNVGLTTETSATTAADALYKLSAAGYDAKESTTALSAAIALSNAAEMELNGATGLITNTLDQYNMGIDESARVSNVFVAALGRSKIDVENLSASLRAVGPLAEASGMSFEGTVAALGALSNVGFTGAKAGMALTAVLDKLLVPTKEVTDVMGKYGIAMSDVDPKTKSFADIVDVLGKKSMTTSDIMAVFGAGVGVKMVSLLNQGGDAIRKLQTDITGTNDAFVAAEVIDNNYISATERLAAATGTLQIILGTPFQASLRMIIDGMAGVVGAFATFIQQTGIVTAAGGFLTTVTAALGAGFTMLNPIFSAAGGALTVIGVAISAVITSFTAMIAAGGPLSGMLTPLSAVIGSAATSMQTLFAQMLGVNPALISFGAAMAPVTTAVTTWATGLMNSVPVQSAFMSAINAIGSVVQSLVGTLTAAVASIITFAGGFRFEAITSGQSIIATFIETVVGLGLALADGARLVLEFVTNTTTLNAVWTVVSGAVSIAVAAFNTFVNVLYVAANALTAAMPAITAVGTAITAIGQQIASGNISGAFATLVAAVVAGMTSIISAITANAGKIGAGLITMFQTGFAAVVSGLSALIAPVATSIGTFLTSTLPAIAPVVSAAITSAIRTAWTTALTALSAVFESGKSFGEMLTEFFSGTAGGGAFDPSVITTLFEGPVSEAIKGGTAILTLTLKDGLVALKAIAGPIWAEVIAAMAAAINLAPVGNKLKADLQGILTAFDAAVKGGSWTTVWDKVKPLVEAGIKGIGDAIMKAIPTSVVSAIKSGLDLCAAALVLGIGLWAAASVLPVAAGFATISAAIAAAIAAFPITIAVGLAVLAGVMIGYFAENGMKWAALATTAVAGVGLAILTVIIGWPAAIGVALVAITAALMTYFSGDLAGTAEVAGDAAGAIVDAIVSVFKGAVSIIGSAFGLIWAGLKAAGGAVLTVGGEIAKVVIAGIVAVFSGAAAVLSGAWNAVWSFLTAFVGVVGPMAAAVGNAIITAITTIFSGAVSILTTAWAAIWTFMTTFVTTVAGYASAIGTAIIQGIVTFFGTGAALIMAAFMAIWTFMTTMSETMSGYAGDVGNALIDGLVEIIQGAGETVGAAFNEIWAFISDAVTTVAGFAKEVGDAFINGIIDLLTAAVETVKTAANAIWNFVGEMITAVGEFGKNIGQSIIDGITAAITAGVSIVTGIMDSIVATVKGVFDSVMSYVDMAKNAYESVKNMIGLGDGGDTGSAPPPPTYVGGEPQADGGILKARRGGVNVTAAEAGMNEAFVPLPDGNSIPVSFGNLPDFSALAAGGSGSTMNNVSINFGNVSINNDMDEKDFFNRVEKTVSNALYRRNGE